MDVASSKHGKLNPFQIISALDDENDDGTRNSFFSHLQFLEEFYRMILTGINADSLELLNKLTIEVYGRKGIMPTTDLSALTPADYPTFDDFAALIDEKLVQAGDDYNRACLKVIENYIAKFKSGGRNSNLWNGASGFETDENFVCFDFQKLLANKNGQIANAQMLLVLKYLENEVIRNRDYNLKNGTDRKIIVVVDECHLFIAEKYPIALDFMYQMAKRIRKYNGMEIVITQSIHIRKTIQRIYIRENGIRHTELMIDTPKTATSIRDIPMTKDLLSVLKPLRKVVNDSFFVLTNDSTPTEPRTYRNYYKKLLVKLDIPPIKFHGLRHSFATRCIESHCDYKTVSVILGHSNISTTLNLYVHPNYEQKKKCIDRMLKSLR